VATVKSIMSACSLFHKFREPDKTAKLKDAKTNTIVLYQLQLVSPLKTCDWLISKQLAYTGASNASLSTFCVCIERVALFALMFVDDLKYLIFDMGTLNLSKLKVLE